MRGVARGLFFPALWLMVLSGCAHTPRAGEPPRGRAFWLALRDAKFELPAGESRAAVLRDAEALVDAEDPVLRDDVGYGLVVAWVYREHAVPAPVLVEFTDHLQQRLARLEGPVLGRSFSALSLSIIAASELKEPVFTQAQFDSLVESATDALALEPDLRGHDPKVGWIHATAHVADLLKFLARNERLSGPQQQRIVNAVVHRLSHGPAFVWGEDERLASVLRSLVMRKDAHLAVLGAWLLTLPPAWKLLWSRPVLDRDTYAQLGNVKQTLRALYVQLAATEASPLVEATRAEVLDALGALQ